MSEGWGRDRAWTRPRNSEKVTTASGGGGGGGAPKALVALFGGAYAALVRARCFLVFWASRALFSEMSGVARSKYRAKLCTDFA